MAFLSACSVHRLVRDHREVLANPLPDVAAAPVDDLFVWHGSVRSTEECLGGAAVHFLLVFPPDYPASAPEVRLFQLVPHPNVRVAVSNRAHGKTLPREARWRLSVWDCVPDTDTWSSAYSVLSVLLQLQAFLLIEDMAEYATSSTAVTAATQAALAFSCPGCSHQPQAPYPSFHTPEDIHTITTHVKRSRRCISRPSIPVRQLPPVATAQHSPASPSPSPSPSTPVASKPAPSTNKSTAAKPVDKQQAEEQWQVVSHGKLSKAKGAAANASVPQVTVPTTNTFQALKLQSVVKKVQAGHTALQCKPSLATVSATAATIVPAPSSGQMASPPATMSPVLSKTAKKNAARKLKRQQQASPGTAKAPSPGPATPAPATPQQLPPLPAPSSASPSSTDQDWVQVPSKGKAQPASTEAASSSTAALKQQVAQLATRTHQDLIQQTVAEWQQQLNHTSAGKPPAMLESADPHQQQAMVQATQPAGLFSKLRRDELLSVLCLLRPRDLAALSCTCQGLRAVCQDGALWQALLQSHFPTTGLAASRMSDWRHAYVLEANNVLEDLKCFYTRATFEEDVLCLPLNYTVNPVTKAVDYIEAYPDFIALSAFTGGVTLTSRRETVKAVLPLYITAEHFARAGPHYSKLLKELAPTLVGPGGTAPPPSAWLDVLGKVLNTAVVLLCDHGIVASHRALLVFVAVHRLLLAMCEEHKLWLEVQRRLDQFLAHPKNRSKEACANLGLWLPLLSLSRRHTWQQLGKPLLEESLARNVMWMCKANPSLEKRFTASGSEADPELLTGSWEAALVSKRLMLFHHAFLCLVGAPPGTTLQHVMDTADALYGHPGAALASRFMRAINKIMKVSRWSEWFSLLGMPGMTDRQLTAILRSAWTRSCKAGYTKPGMDYGRIQASGVSKILLKGQTYSAPPTMTKMELVDHWSWKASGDTKYLDASMLLYETKTVGSTVTRRWVETIDYRHMVSRETREAGAVLHSGDIMQDGRGKHTVQVDLRKLGDNINELYVVVSAWAGAKLSDIVQPMVQVCDPDTGMVLCEYHLEQQSGDVRMAKSSVIMARVHRVENGVKGWRVQALGLVGDGCAGSYRPIEDNIRTGVWQ